MTRGTNELDDPQPTEVPRPLQYERQLAWPWSLAQTDPVKLQRFARRAALVRRLGWLVALLLVASAFTFLYVLSRQSGAIR
jgi:hypothetical protein